MHPMRLRGHHERGVRTTGARGFRSTGAGGLWSTTGRFVVVAGCLGPLPRPPSCNTSSGVGSQSRTRRPCRIWGCRAHRAACAAAAHLRGVCLVDTLVRLLLPWTLVLRLSVPVPPPAHVGCLGAPAIPARVPLPSYMALVYGAYPQEHAQPPLCLMPLLEQHAHAPKICGGKNRLTD